MPSTLTDKELETVAGHFAIEGRFLQALPHGSGHINDTYASTFSAGPGARRYIHQRINDRVFKDPVRLMENILRVTQHQARHGGALSVIPARDGKPYHVDAEGRFWRSYVFIENARTYDLIESPAQAESAARAFGAFQRALADLPGAPLHETIPNFHNTPHRVLAFEAALARDPLERAKGCAEELAFAREMAAQAGWLERLRAGGEIPVRVTHNDTKLNNVMLDEATGEGVCVIDLDTVMPGLAPCDFGDMVRSSTSAAKEDEKDLGKVVLQWPMFEALARGYLASSGGFLCRAERDNLAMAGLLMTYECGLRFLTDYLEGDLYFKTSRPGQNLDRARNQFRLAQEIEKNLGKMQRLISQL
jgi:hypothetical protein